MLDTGGLVYDFGAEVASLNTLSAGEAWRSLRKSVQKIRDTGLKNNTVAELLADEFNLSRERSKQLLSFIIEAPTDS